jgi:hypothetical protein
MTKAQALKLIRGCGKSVLSGTSDEVRDAAFAECIAAAREQGYTGTVSDYSIPEADTDYILAQIMASQPED